MFGPENCYTCHANYGMFGTVKTKLGGMRHVYEYVFHYRNMPLDEAREAVRREMERINREVPGVRLTLLNDNAKFIERSITAVQEHVLIGSVLVILIIFLFLRDLKSTLIICTSIPISVIGTFALLYFAGFTLNTMTFGGLALGVGMIVDASIVVLENTYRHMEQGKPRMQAAIDGSEEVWSAIVASTLTHVAVFVPLLFLSGVSSILFKQLAYVVMFSLSMSLFVAVTIVPVLCSRILKLPEEVLERVRRGALSSGHAKVLSGLPGEEEQVRLARVQEALDGLVNVLPPTAPELARILQTLGERSVSSLKPPQLADLLIGVATADEAGAEHKRLAAEIAESDRLYYQEDAPKLSDADYDALRQRLEAIEDALCYGQDWRDFNVHCAIVNELLARAIAGDAAAHGDDKPPLVLTGDLMNEFLADYTPVSYNNRDYYRLPRVSPGELRAVLIRGLDAGDREVGIFNHHGIDVIQPYGLLIEQYLQLPESYLGEERAKQRLAKEVGGDLLPGFVLERTKVRAQIGSSTQASGILGVLMRRGYDPTWLRKAFCHLFMVKEETFLNQFIRAGRYRFISEFPNLRWKANGYLTG